MGKLLDEAVENAPNRRGFLAKTGLFGAATLAAAGLRNVDGQTTAAPTDADILNFALNLEYLEAEFYTVATTGLTIDKMGIGITGSGAAGATTGGGQVNFAASNSNAPMASAIAMEIAYDERAHVTYIRAALAAAGATPIAKPAN
jgi:Ferritin-like domain